MARRRTTDPNPDDGFRGLYITPDQVDALLSDAQPLDTGRSTATDMLVAVEASADSAEARDQDIRLRRLQRDFGLDALDVEILLITLAPDLDSRFERLYGYLHDDVSRRRPSIGLCLELCGASTVSASARRRFTRAGPLASGRLLLVEEPDRPQLTRSVRVPDRVTAHLLGDDVIDASLIGLAEVRRETLHAPCWLRDHPVLPDEASIGYVRNGPASIAVEHAIAAARAAKRSVIVVDLARLGSEAEPTEVAALVAREARLLDAGVAVTSVETIAARGAHAIRPFAEIQRPVVMTGSLPWDPAWSSRVPVLWEAPRLSVEDRVAVWRTELGDDFDSRDAARTTAQYRLNTEQIARAAAAARLQAVARGRTLIEQDLKFGARSQNSASLDRLARRVEPVVGLDDVVLPSETMELLRDMVVRVRHRDTVLETWKVGGSSAARRGLTALFAGPSGTGKTMTAEAIAFELGLELCAIDLAAVVDKYIGETEKHLDRIFHESERINCVLLFDEADALFGKRSEVSDAHDRYANIETAYLLQRMEQFDGIAILATNLRANLDEAFSRRLDVIIDFAEPDEQQRLLLWQRSLGQTVPRSDDVDLVLMARSFTLSGGNIRNAAVTAAFLAAGRGEPLSGADLVKATRREYRKVGRLCVDGDFE